MKQLWNKATQLKSFQLELERTNMTKSANELINAQISQKRLIRLTSDTGRVGVIWRSYSSPWLILLRQPRTSPADSDYALPVVTNFLCRVTNSAHLVVGPSLSLDQWLGIRCRLTSVIRHVVTSLSDVHWKHSCSLSTSVSSALEVFLRRCAI